MSSVLLVDDEEGIRALMSRWLDGLGHESRQASSAEQALEEMARDEADVAVCDISMPGRDGLWLAAQLRERPSADGHHHGYRLAGRGRRAAQPPDTAPWTIW